MLSAINCAVVIFLGMVITAAVVSEVVEIVRRRPRIVIVGAAVGFGLMVL